LPLLAEEEAVEELPAILAAAEEAAGVSVPVGFAAPPQTAGLLCGIGVKLIAGMTAVAVAGGAVVYTAWQEPATDSTPQATQETSLDVYTASEKFLSAEITPYDLETNYYAYLDLEQDGVPELLISDNRGTKEDVSSAELYRYDGERFSLCGKTGARYAPFYVVNGTQLLGQSRLGKEYTGITEQVETAAYHWNDEMTRNDPAIRKNGGAWEYITETEFDYYNFLPDQTEGETYIQTAERVELERNPFRQESFKKKTEVIQTPYYRISIPDHWAGKYVDETQYEEDTAKTFVYEKESHVSLDAEGILFWVTMYPTEEDISFLPSYKVVGECKVKDAVYQVIVGIPTDVQFAPEQMDAYLALAEDLPWICENLEVFAEYKK